MARYYDRRRCAPQHEKPGCSGVALRRTGAGCCPDVSDAHNSPSTSVRVLYKPPEVRLEIMRMKIRHVALVLIGLTAALAIANGPDAMGWWKRRSRPGAGSSRSSSPAPSAAPSSEVGTACGAMAREGRAAAESSRCAPRTRRGHTAVFSTARQCAGQPQQLVDYFGLHADPVPRLEPWSDREGI